MACSRFEYVKGYEADDRLLPGCWIVVRLDGRGFTRFSELHGFAKPNDTAALALMDAAACELLREFPEVRLAYGESDEYSFVLPRSSELFGRRASKLVSLFASCFTAHYVRLWTAHLPATPLTAAPMFDARAVLYPDDATLRDYLAWRQADAHVNNQYNTCFWALVQSGSTPAQAQAALRGTDTAHKNELLFSRFGVNYSELPERFRKGSVVLRAAAPYVAKTLPDGTAVTRERVGPVVLHVDLIRDEFWAARPELLAR
jgi:tRNA(His) guanylyltransferase